MWLPRQQDKLLSLVLAASGLVPIPASVTAKWLSLKGGKLCETATMHACSTNAATNLSNGCDSAVAPLTVQVELGELSKIIQRRPARQLKKKSSKNL